MTTNHKNAFKKIIKSITPKGYLLIIFWTPVLIYFLINLPSTSVFWYRIFQG